MIVSKKCAAQTIPTDTTVLKYLYKEAASAYYLRIDTALTNKILVTKDSIIVTKDSLISNRNKALSVCELEKSVKDSQISSYNKELKKERKNVFIYKLTTILAGISTVYFFFR